MAQFFDRIEAQLRQSLRQLADDIELMLYRLRRTDGTVAPASSGTVIFPDGRTRHLSAEEARVEVLDHWTSPSSGARYPSRWRVTIPALAGTLELNAYQITGDNNTIINRGVPRERVETATRTRVERVAVRDLPASERQGLRPERLERQGSAMVLARSTPPAPASRSGFLRAAG